jgi:hypothetical protein
MLRDQRDKFVHAPIGIVPLLDAKRQSSGSPEAIGVVRNEIGTPVKRMTKRYPEQTNCI